MRKTKAYFRQLKSETFYMLRSSVVDPWHFGTDPDPHHWLTDPDPAPDPVLFVSGFQDVNKNKLFSKLFAYFFLQVDLHQSSKIKK